MRLRKEPDTMQEQEVLLIAEVSDAFAHPARIKMFRYIMKCKRENSCLQQGPDCRIRICAGNHLAAHQEACGRKAP